MRRTRASETRHSPDALPNFQNGMSVKVLGSALFRFFVGRALELIVGERDARAH
jgi:hypothetical protein